jgi:hypothetical protein
MGLCTPQVQVNKLLVVPAPLLAVGATGTNGAAIIMTPAAVSTALATPGRPHLLVRHTGLPY